jgi:hypothetical protein
LGRVTIDPTGVLVVAGKKVFPIGVSNPPPVGRRAPSGKSGLAELASAGVTFMRTGIADWRAPLLDGQLAGEKTKLDAAAAAGLLCWLWLGDLPNLPTTAGSPREQLLRQVVNAFKSHPGLGAWKGIDEPRNRFRGDDWIRPAGLTRALDVVKQLDANHPLVIIQAPGSSVQQLVPYRPTFDITGADIYPIAYPPGNHAGTSNKDISVVGDVAATMRSAAGPKPFWMTLQIAWSGVTPTDDRPDVVPRFPSLHQERFMAYQAIVNGARGLMFFGGHITQVLTPEDAALGWNWTFYGRVLKPLVRELTSDAIRPLLVAPAAQAVVTTSVAGVETAARRQGSTLWVVAVRRGDTTSQVTFSGLPSRLDGSALAFGEVLGEYVQRPPSPPIEPGSQALRRVTVANGSFRDWLGGHDARIYRFRL